MLPDLLQQAYRPSETADDANVFATCLSFSAHTQHGHAALIGKWEFTAYAERSTPDVRTPVGVMFEFRQDGTMIASTPNGDVESKYSIDGETLQYSGPDGEQTWTVRSFEPDVSIVMENRTTVIYLERR